MLQEIARVFSSNGVLIQGSQSVPAPKRQAASAAAAPAAGALAPGGQGPANGAQDGDDSGSGAKFDQASSKLELSRRGRELQSAAAASAQPDGAASADAKATQAKSAAGVKTLTPEEEKQVRELKKRDTEVKAHEAAHQAAAGGQARGGAAFDYQTGPDGKNYAVGGHVDIDVSPVQGNPQATLEHARTAQRAALAPADPSGQDRAVAAAAAQMAAQAQAEMTKGKGADKESGTGDVPERGPGPANADRMRAYGRPSAARASFNVFA
ncbi:MAG: hypothetical protein JF616_05605 [Fibrobacteres bacterium]|nr:hypothetical protein [Fibrobacterota bacterium]